MGGQANLWRISRWILHGDGLLGSDHPGLHGLCEKLSSSQAKLLGAEEALWVRGIKIAIRYDKSDVVAEGRTT
jgi:hypothetical protein